jgi:Histidine kinase-, DNA gyrase B-, and HSP90-like ATPase
MTVHQQGTKTDPEAIVNAFPTKELFIKMLVKDITLIPAIKDLVDNSVDGARRLRPDGNYKGLWIHVQFNAKEFKVSDNCGGIDNDTARKYAFRFGRPEEAGLESIPSANSASE